MGQDDNLACLLQVGFIVDTWAFQDAILISASRGTMF